MKSLLHAESRDALRRRLAALRPNTVPKWGKFSAPQMVAHLIQSLGMMTGDVHVVTARVPWVVRNAPLKHMLIHVIPFPKGLPTSPELLARNAISGVESGPAWSAELSAFDEALERIPIVAEAGRWPAHPAFGPLSGQQWGVQQYRHLDHHFRQFGV
ncbi:MAG: DUF1569 domain-containing protein [Gemmatimonadaceae bacterium]